MTVRTLLIRKHRLTIPLREMPVKMMTTNKLR